MLHCTNYLSSQQQSTIIRNHSNQCNHSNKRKTMRSSGENLNPVAALFLSSESSESFPTKRTISSGVARRFVSIVQADKKSALSALLPNRENNLCQLS
jgi:hypothetical protein